MKEQLLPPDSTPTPISPSREGDSRWFLGIVISPDSPFGQLLQRVGIHFSGKFGIQITTEGSSEPVPTSPEAAEELTVFDFNSDEPPEGVTKKTWEMWKRARKTPQKPPDSSKDEPQV